MTERQVHYIATQCYKNHSNRLSQVMVYKLRKFKLPVFNGRPQLWLRGYEAGVGLRIIYSNGKVEYCSQWDANFYRGCTSAKDQETAALNCIAYDLGNLGWRLNEPEFLGYL
jgi:hypothetical protein